MIHDDIQVIQHLIVGEAQHTIAVLLKMVGACLILLTLLLMNCTINFDHQFRCRAVKVQHERADRVLTTKP